MAGPEHQSIKINTGVQTYIRSVFISFLTGLVCLFEHGCCGRDEQFRGCLLGDCMIRRLGLVQLLEIMPAFETETQR
jgi:hypothetical protein